MSIVNEMVHHTACPLFLLNMTLVVGKSSTKIDWRPNALSITERTYSTINKQCNLCGKITNVWFYNFFLLPHFWSCLMGVKNCGKHHKAYDHIKNNLWHHCLNYQFCSNQGAPREQEDLLKFSSYENWFLCGFYCYWKPFHAWRLI